MTIARQLRARPIQVLSILLMLNGGAVALMMQQAAESGIWVPLIGAGALMVTLASLIALARLFRDPLERLESTIRSLNAEVARGGTAVAGLGLTLASSGDVTASTRSLLRVRQVLADRHRKAEEDDRQRRKVDEILATEILKQDAMMQVRQTAAAELADALRRVANGELGLMIELAMPAELEAVRINFNRASALLAQNMGLENGGHAAIVRDTGMVLADSAELAAQGVRQATGIVEMRRISKLLGLGAEARAAEAEELSALAMRVRLDLVQSAEMINKARLSMTVAAEASAQMDNTAARVRDTLRDTSLAALNAGIAAVQAGEAGAALSDVLRELRSLAERSSQAAGMLSINSQGNTGKTAAAVAAIDRASREIEAIALYVEALDDRAAMLSRAEREDVEVLAGAERTARELESGARDHANAVEKTVTAVTALSRSLGRVELQVGTTLGVAPSPAQDNVRPRSGRPYLRRVK